MTKIFISQPMADRDINDVEYERNELRKKILKKYKDAVIVNSFFLSYLDGDCVNPLRALGESIVKLSEADIIVFADGWENSRGCRIEHRCATDYGIVSVYCKDLK